MIWVETDRKTGASVYQLTDDRRPADNIYGEQPYSSPEGDKIAIRHYPAEGEDGGLSILDLNDGSVKSVVETAPRFPAFHAWGEYLYFQEAYKDTLQLKRCRYDAGHVETVTALPGERGRFSYGTVSPTERWYAVSVHHDETSCEVLLLDLTAGRRRTLAKTEEYYFKHEQFSRDGTDRVLIQANKMPDVKQVFLGTMETDGEGVRWLAADRPHTPRPTGHEAWVGTAHRVFFSTAYEEQRRGNLWTVGVGEPGPSLVCESAFPFAHVSVSRCGRYWVADATGEEGVPLYVGSFDSGEYRRLLYSRTVHDGKQWSHTHPYLTADNRWLIYTSNRSGLPQVHGARISEGFLESL